MSADSWDICPRCGGDPSIESTWTLREDYELGVMLARDLNLDQDGHIFFVDYTAQCRTCGWKFTFKHQQEVR